MAASNNAYYSQKFNTRTSNGTLVQHSLAIPNTDLVTIKNRFYLDKVFQTNVADSTPSFVGGCLVGSFNYNHHNTSRIGALRSYDNGIIVFFTDAGLNTLGDAATPVITNATVEKYTISNTIFKSSFYSDTTVFGFIIIGNGNRLDKRIEFGTITKNSIANASYGSNPFDGYELAPVAGEFMGIKCFIINEDGTHESSITNINVKPYAKIMGFSSQYASFAKTEYNNNQTSTYYFSRFPISTVYVDGFGLCRVFSDEAMQSVPPNAGFLCDGDKWYEMNINSNGYRVITNDGIVGSYQSNDPASSSSNDYIVYTFNGYGDTRSNACYADTFSSYTTYFKTSTSTHYTDSSLTTFPLNGFYRVSLSNGNENRVIQIVDGKEIGSYDLCS